MGRYSRLTQDMISYSKSYQYKMPRIPRTTPLTQEWLRNMGTAAPDRQSWLITLMRYQLRGKYRRDATPALLAGDEALHALAYGPIEYWRLALWALEYRSMALQHGRALLGHCGRPAHGESRAQWLERTIDWVPRTDNGMTNPQLAYRWRTGAWLSPDAWARMLERNAVHVARAYARKKQLATKQKLDSGNSVG